RLLVLVETLGSGISSGEVRLVAYQSGNPLPRTVSFPSAAMFTLLAGRHAEEWLVSTPESLARVKVGPSGPEVESVHTLTLGAGRASGAVRMGNVVYGESGAEILMEPFEVRVPNVASVLSTLAEGGRARSYLETNGRMRVVDTSTGELRSSHGVPPARNGLLPRRFVAWGRDGFAALTSDRMECLVWRSPYVAAGTADVGLTVTAPTSVTLDSTPSGIGSATLTWRWVVTNAGPDRAEGVMLDLPLLGSQWVGRLEPGELREFRETRVGSQFGWVTGEGRVSSGTRDLVRGNQRVVARTLVREPALGDARHVAVAPGELAASADGARLWVVRDSDHDGEEPGLLEIDPLTGLGVRTLPTDTPPRRLRVDPSGGWVGAVLGSDTVVEWELGAGGREVRWAFPGEQVRDGVWVPRQPGVRIVATDRRTVVWENGRARAQAAPGLSDAGWVGVARGILWMADADTLSAYRITPEGLVAEGGPWPRSWTGSNSAFTADETRLYFDHEVFDLDRRVFVGSDLGLVVASDPASGSVYELSGWWLRRFTAGGLEFRGEMRGPSTWLGARQLVRWGERGLALLRPDGLLWIDEMAVVSEAARSDVAVSLIPNVSEEYVGERVWRVHVTNLGALPVARVAVSLEGVSRMDPRGMETTGGHALGGVVFWDLEDVPAGGTVVLPVWLQFPEGPFRIQARVATGAAGDSPTNNWAEVSGMARHPVADLKSGWASPAASEVWSAAFAGRLSVTNASSLEVADVEVRIRRSPGLSVATASPGEIDAQSVTESVVVRLGSLAPGASTTVDVGFRVPGPGVYPVVAEVAGRNTEPTPADNRASMLLVAGWGTEIDGVRELSLPLVSAWAWDPRARELVGGVEGVSILVSVDPTGFRATRSMALPGVPRKVVLSADGEVAWVDLAGGGCLRIFRDRRLILDSWVWPWTSSAAPFSWAVLPAGLDRDVLIAHGRGDDGVLSVLAYRGGRRLPTEYRLPNGLVGELTVSQDGRIWVSRAGSLVELVLRESGLEFVREYPAAMGAAGRASWLGSRLIYESGIVADLRTGTVDPDFGGGGSCYADPEVNWAYRVRRLSNERGDAPVVVEGFESADWRRVWQQPLATEFTRVETMVPMGTNGLLVQSTTAAWWVPVNATQERTAGLGVRAAGPMEVDSQLGLVTLPLGVTHAGPWVARAELFVDFGDELRPLGGLEGTTGSV
ncbi:MAG: hypothetical protein IT580_18470, partial [Verrucomicrobiales bacterium]|nr:hypothetical protein [Verrucomicrobiales bacterium]